jgi:uncharacterized membrane protein YkvA (DUF1232 family)
MPLNLARLRTYLSDVPKHGKLAYCLLRDDRIPAPPKAALLGTLGLVISPLDFPAWIPVLGELDMLALSILAVKVFVDACPEAIVREHEAALRRGDSVFDRDFHEAVVLARTALREGVDRVMEVASRRRERPDVAVQEDRSA